MCFEEQYFYPTNSAKIPAKWLLPKNLSLQNGQKSNRILVIIQQATNKMCHKLEMPTCSLKNKCYISTAYSISCSWRPRYPKVNTKKDPQHFSALAWHRAGALTAVVADRKQQYRQRLGAASFLSFAFTKRHVHICPHTFCSDKLKRRGCFAMWCHWCSLRQEEQEEEEEGKKNQVATFPQPLR